MTIGKCMRRPMSLSHGPSEKNNRVLYRCVHSHRIFHFGPEASSASRRFTSFVRASSLASIFALSALSCWSDIFANVVAKEYTVNAANIPTAMVVIALLKKLCPLELSLPLLAPTSATTVYQRA